MPSQRPHLAVFRLVEVAEVETLVDGEPADIRIEVFEDAANAVKGELDAGTGAGTPGSAATKIKLCHDWVIASTAAV